MVIVIVAIHLLSNKGKKCECDISPLLDCKPIDNRSLEELNCKPIDNRSLEELNCKPIDNRSLEELN